MHMLACAKDLAGNPLPGAIPVFTLAESAAAAARVQHSPKMPLVRMSTGRQGLKAKTRGFRGFRVFRVWGLGFKAPWPGPRVCMC